MYKYVLVHGYFPLRIIIIRITAIKYIILAACKHFAVMNTKILIFGFCYSNN
jgi:hypothetical protein